MDAATVGYLLVLWVNSSGSPFVQTPVLQKFETQKQCDVIGGRIQSESKFVRSYECIGIPTS